MKMQSGGGIEPCETNSEDGGLEVGDSVPKPLGFNALAPEWLLRSIPRIPGG
jgi:hypothetical protein